MSRWTFSILGDSQVLMTLLPGICHPLLAAHVQDVPLVPLPHPSWAKTFPVMNQQERMLPASGQWQQPSSSPRDNEAAVGLGARYA